MAAKQVPKVHFGKFENYGQHIYLYKHIQTNQVVYSLTQVMNNAKIMDQLPFYGKKSRPAALRRDHWKPFASVTLPPALPPSATRPTHPAELYNNSATVKDPNFLDGLRLFQILREMRTLRDYAWRKIPHMNEKISAVCHKSKRAMMSELRDQRATAVADLAKALFMREEWVERDFEELRKRYDLDAAQQGNRWAKVEAYAEGVGRGRVDALDKGIQKNLARLSRLREQGKKDEDDEVKVLRRRIIELKTHRSRMLRCKDAVDYVNGIAVPEERQEKWSKTLRALIEEEKQRREQPTELVLDAASRARKDVLQNFLDTDATAQAETSSSGMQGDAQASGARTTEVQSKRDQESGFLHRDFTAAETEYAAAAKRVGWLPTEDNLAKPWIKPSGYVDPSDLFLEHRRYVWKIKGRKKFSDTHTIGYPKGESVEVPDDAIKIKWLDIRDAQYAEAWPGNVYHVQMGLLGRHTAYTMPHPDAGPMFEVNVRPEEPAEEGVELDREVSEEPPSKDGEGKEKKDKTDGDSGDGKQAVPSSFLTRVMDRLPFWRSRAAGAAAARSA